MQALDLAITPLDAARRAVMRVALRSGLLARILARRDARIACLACIQITLLFALAVRFPVALYFLGPVAFGVVHLAADVRYLALRRSPPRALLLGSIAFALAITASQVATAFRILPLRTGEKIDVTLGMLWIAYALCIALRFRPYLALTALFALLGCGSWLLARAHLANIALVHVHNVIAIVVWLALFRRRRMLAALPIALVVLFVGVLLSGAYLPLTIAHGGLDAFGFRGERLAAWLAPGVSIEAAVRLTMTFVFLQGVHYAAWTGWIPQDDLRGEGTLTFRMTVRGLLKDFGPIALGCIAAIALAMVGLSYWNIRTSVIWYLVLAKAHAWFELSFLAFYIARAIDTLKVRPAPRPARLAAA